MNRSIPRPSIHCLRLRNWPQILRRAEGEGLWIPAAPGSKLNEFRSRRTAHVNQTSRGRPISDLPVMASILDSMLHDDEGQYRTLCECRPKPYVLDDHTVGRVIQVFTQQKADLPLYQQQLAHWMAGDLTASQRWEVERLQGCVTKLQA